jgi:hypothetical protein
VVDVVDVAGVVAAAAVAVVVELELLALPQPATIKAAVASAATPTIRNLAVIRLAIVISQCVDFS